MRHVLVLAELGSFARAARDLPSAGQRRILPLVRGVAAVLRLQDFARAVGPGRRHRAGLAAAIGRRGAEGGAGVRLVYRVHRSISDPKLFLFYETHVGEAAFDLHRNAPHIAAYRQRRAQEKLADGAVEMEIFRSFAE